MSCSRGSGGRRRQRSVCWSPPVRQAYSAEPNASSKRSLAWLAALLLWLPGANGWADDHGALRAITTDGLGNPDNYGFHRLYQAQGYLFMPSGNWVEGAILYRSRDGENWQAVSPPGIDGDLANDSIVSLAWFRDRLYVATYDFRAPGDNQNGGDIWRANADAADPADIVWENITKDAFGDPSIQAFVGFVVLKGHLYAGTFNLSGSEIFRTATGDPGDWHHVSPRGMDDPACSTDFHLNITFGEHAYFGSEEANCLGARGGDIWRTNGDLSDGQRTLDGWEKVTAAPGFGHDWNNNIFGMDVFQGHFYAGTWTWTTPGAEIFRAPVIPPHEGVTPAPFEFEQVNESGWGDDRFNGNTSIVHLGDTLYVSGIDISGPGANGPGYFMRTSGAPETGTTAEHLTTWTSMTAPGFPPSSGPGEFPGDGPYWLEVFRNKIYIAVEQGGKGTAGRGQLWVYEPSNVPKLAITRVTPVVYKGCKIRIRGTGFDDYQADSQVLVDGAPVPVRKWTDTRIVAAVPIRPKIGPGLGKRMAVAVYKDGLTADGGSIWVFPQSPWPAGCRALARK